jgi:hypothetical protein
MTFRGGPDGLRIRTAMPSPPCGSLAQESAGFIPPIYQDTQVSRKITQIKEPKIAFS